MSCTRPDSPSSFPCFFFHARRSGVRRRGGFRRMERTRPDSPSIFVPPFFPRQEEWRPLQEWHPPHGPQARIALVFSPFFPRQVEWCPPQEWHPHGPQARLAFVFSPLFSAPGGAAPAWAAPGPTRLRVFSPFFPRQEEWHPHGPQARLAFVFFPLFSTSGGVGWRRQLRVEGASQA